MTIGRVRLHFVKSANGYVVAELMNTMVSKHDVPTGYGARVRGGAAR